MEYYEESDFYYIPAFLPESSLNPSTHERSVLFHESLIFATGREPGLHFRELHIYHICCHGGAQGVGCIFAKEEGWKVVFLKYSLFPDHLKNVIVARCGFILFLMKSCWSWCRNQLFFSIKWKLRKNSLLPAGSWVYSLILSLFQRNAFRSFSCIYIQYF